MTVRTTPVVELLDRVPPGPMRNVIDTLQRTLGKTVSLTTLELVKDLAGYQITDAAVSPGTDIPEARTAINFGDAGVDNVRLVVRGNNSAAGTVTVEVYQVTTDVTIASVEVTDAAQATFQGEWTLFTPDGTDEPVGLRVVGDGAFDPTVYRVELQMRTLRKST